MLACCLLHAWSEAATIKKSSTSDKPPIRAVSAAAKLPRNTLTNHEVLTKLGLRRLHVPSSHSRKRLAVESRHHYAEDDSKMYVIKLPPNPYYYAHTKPDKKNALSHMSKKVPVGFKSNGKPGKIYHWNIPTLKKMNGGYQKVHSRSQLSRHDDGDMFDIQKTPTWTAMDVRKVQHGLNYGKPLKHTKKTPTYYVPMKTKKAGSFQKYFPGNGKPKSFYVIEKSKRPTHVQRLMP